MREKGIGDAVKAVTEVNQSLGRAVFAELLKSVAADPAMILGKKRSCLHEADKYTAEKVIKTLVNQLMK